jgi:aspartyl aminopeptidase
MAVMAPLDPTVTDRLMSFIDASPSPFHAVANAAAVLEAAGAKQLLETDSWDDVGGARYVIRDGALVAWWLPEGLPPTAAFRLVGAHTDSPNLRIKPRPDTGRAGYRQLGVEVYGGALFNSWLDRDLGLSGRVAVRADDGRIESQLLAVSRPVLRIPQLAIHLDREVNELGLRLDPQLHLVPVIGLGSSAEGGFAAWLSGEAGAEVLAWDLMCHDVTPAARLGIDDELLAAARIDNLASCHAATEALAAAVGDETDVVPVLALFDHEEVGSVSASGAFGTMLPDVLERLVLARGGDRQDLHRAVAASWCVSTDGAHAVHPNYVERYEPEHQITLNGGPVIKVNVNVRYASDAVGAAMFASVCGSAGVPVQRYAHRSNLACGSTIGPLTAANLGMRTVDIGMAQLSMHSARELAGAHDPPQLAAALGAFLRS